MVCVEVIGVERLATKMPDSMPALWRALFDLVRNTACPGGLYAYRVGTTIVVALPGTGGDALEEVCSEILAAGKQLSVEVRVTQESSRDTRARRVALRDRLCLGLAERAGSSGHSLGALLLVARNGARVAQNRGGGCRVHTDVYELVEARLQREPDSPALPGELGHELVAEPPVAVVPERREDHVESHPPEEVAEERVRSELERVIEGQATTQRDPGEFEERLRAMVDSMTADALATARQEFAERDRSQREELRSLRSGQADVGQLKRRIAKLKIALEATERRLSDAAKSRGQRGVASAFRSVQGLGGTEKDYDLKLSLLREIVEANLDLRKLISETGLAQVQ